MVNYPKRHVHHTVTDRVQMQGSENFGKLKVIDKEQIVEHPFAYPSSMDIRGRITVQE